MSSIHLRYPMFKFICVSSLVLSLLAAPLSNASASQGTDVSAQGQTVRIFFSPAQVTMPPDTTLSLQIDAGSYQIGFARIDLAFDPSLIRLTDEIKRTELLGNVIQKTTMNDANATGHITIALGLSTGSPFPTGVFEFAQLPFGAVTTASSPGTSVSVVDQNVQIVDRNATPLPFTSEAANISLSNGISTLSLTLGTTLKNRSTTIELRSIANQLPIFSGSTISDASGKITDFPLPGVQPGTYHLLVKPQSWLRRQVSSVQIRSGSNSVDFQPLFAYGACNGKGCAGDINGNNQVDIYDYNTLLVDFGTSNTRSDLDGDGSVNIFDYNALLGAFGASGDGGEIIIDDPNPSGQGADTTGVFRPSNGLLYLKNSNTAGFADVAINYGMSGDYPVVGDWDGNGDTTIGVYRNGQFLLRNSNTIGFADFVFAFGQPGDQPMAGDWNGDGVDTIGIYRPWTGQFLLRNSNTAGPAEISFYLGNVGDVGIAGDWDGDGKDTTGVFRPINGIIFLKNTNDTGFADVALNYGIPGDKPVTGDWDDDGIDTIGVYRNGQFMLRNSNTLGFADIVFGLGNPGDMPIAGNWDGIP